MKHKINFQEKVYGVVKRIPKGKILTYKEVAKKAGSLHAFRVAGNILNKNRDPKVPCHRVIRSNGEIGGYREGANKKIQILRKEGIMIKNGKITP